MGSRGFAARLLPVLLLLAAVCAGGAYANHAPSLTDQTSAGGNGAIVPTFRGASADGTRVFFTTSESLVSADTDLRQDVYERSNGTTTLVSAGQVNGNGSFDAIYGGASQDGTRVFFTTGEPLVSADTDAASDLYQRSAGTTTRVSAGAINGNGANPVTFGGASADGTRVFFATAEQLVSADTDSAIDVYQRFGATTTRISSGQINGNGSSNASFLDASADGTAVFFSSAEQLVSDDTDTVADIYENSSGVITWVSTGELGGNGSAVPTLRAISTTGSPVYFTTSEQLTFDDSDSAVDIYRRFSGSTTRISGGNIGGDVTFGGASDDGNYVFYTTNEPLTSADTDLQVDVYQYHGVTTLVSQGATSGNGAFDATFKGSSTDGTRVFFQTNEALVTEDVESVQDVYERSGGTTRLVSAGDINGNNSTIPAAFAGASDDGKRVFFTSAEKLVNSDADNNTDIYERARGVTARVSAGQINGNSAINLAFRGNSADGTRVYFDTTEALAAGDTDSASDIYTARAPAGYARPVGATPYLVPLVIAYKRCLEPNTIHVPPLNAASCTPPVPASEFLTVGTPDANGQPAKSSGSVRFDAVVGDPATGTDEADTAIAVTFKDTRNIGDLSDYTGELRAQMLIRFTDKYNGGSGTDPGTYGDYDFNFNVPCSATADTTIGGTCSVNTSFDTVVPGILKEGKRTIGRIEHLNMFDGGPDGDADTSTNRTLFAEEGFFVP
jgi:hypothetical protein